MQNYIVIIIHIRNSSSPQATTVPEADLTNISTEMWIANSGKLTH